MSTTLADWARFPEDNLVLPASREEAQHFGAEPWILGSLCSILYLVFGVWFALELGVLGDTLARTANAHFVLFSRDPHLGAIGFVWNPLPSLLSVPLVALKEFWPPLVERGIASVAISAIFGGLSVVYMMRILRRLVVGSWMRRAVVIAFATNPAIVYYSANGMTEMPLIATLLGALDGLLAYLKDRRVVELIKSGGWLAAAFGIRYESVPWAFVIVLLLAIGLARVDLGDIPAPRHRDWISGISIVWMAPLVYTISMWLFFNWAIMGDPLYFMTSTYGNTSQTATSAYGGLEAVAAQGDLFATARFGARQLLLWPLAALAAVAGMVLGFTERKERNAWALMLVAALVSIPLFQLVMVFLGVSAGWVRFFLTMIPFGSLTLAYGVRMIRGYTARRVAGVALVMMLFGSHYFSYLALQPGSPLTHEPLSEYRQAQSMAEFIEGRSGLVLTDTFLSFPIVLHAEDPRSFVITSDRDFRDVLADPAAVVDAVLIPEPEGLGRFDAINQAYPELWTGGAGWAELVAEFDNEFNEASTSSRWRLYEVVGPAPDGTTG